jgi:iron-sulfur cluster assembly protein
LAIPNTKIAPRKGLSVWAGEITSSHASKKKCLLPPYVWSTGYLQEEVSMIKPDQQSEIETNVVSLTPVATAKVLELLAQENDESLGLRIFVAGGGCSGLQYGMTLDEEQDGDTIVPVGDFKVFIDDMSLGYITGSTVDYVDSLMGAGFTVNNPNAVSSCGCGHSFKTADDSDSQPRSCGCGH